MRSLLIAFGGAVWLGTFAATAARAQTAELESSILIAPPARFSVASGPLSLPRDAAFPPDGLQDPRRLAVLDDQGRPIPFDEIHRRVEGGTTGLLIGGAVGLVLGAVAAYAVGELVQCGEAEGLFGRYDLCSPQETALRDVLGGTTFAATVVLGLKVGWDTDAVTWQEAVTRIRAERSAGARR